MPGLKHSLQPQPLEDVMGYAIIESSKADELV
jgi:hypothetical protein